MIFDFLSFTRRSMLGGEYNRLITSELANQCAPKALFTCVVYTIYICVYILYTQILTELQ